ncbi:MULTISPECIES: DUF6286 domain-containing protein [Streptomyces]|uniref:DUF6286 domain-containing protein n=1 Tax=Streptomyces lonegramiae TaxID=3075524 RepID=A0ABU2XUN9_9ACTN|nr:DUF6286 domain-containing protein [Streptomyces sp. DSM 41529]MDT0548755.1 DUF6286 domain-containing protein [Streptomyces sp. DSM 41529]
MTTDLVPTPPAALGPPETRGRTEIADRVLERIAVRAVTEVDQAGGAQRRLLGMPLGRANAPPAPRATAHVDGHLATVAMTVSVAYPAPIRQVSRRVRERVAARIGELTGLDVREVDIDVARLSHPAAPRTTVDHEAPSAPPQAVDRQRRRAAIRAFRPRRTLPAVLIAALLAAVALLATIQVVASLINRDAQVLPVTWLTRAGRDLRWDDPAVLAAAAAILAVGVLLVALALAPGRPRMIALRSEDPQTTVGITRAGLRRCLTAAVGGMDGIDRAHVRLRRRRVHVNADSPLHDVGDLPQRVRQAVTGRLDELSPMRPLHVRTTVRGREE